jgi:hypothetical protein
VRGKWIIYKIFLSRFLPPSLSLRKRDREGERVEGKWIVYKTFLSRFLPPPFSLSLRKRHREGERVEGKWIVYKIFISLSPSISLSLYINIHNERQRARVLDYIYICVCVSVQTNVLPINKSLGFQSNSAFSLASNTVVCVSFICLFNGTAHLKMEKNFEYQHLVLLRVIWRSKF